MMKNMGGSEGILIDGGIIHRGQSFSVTVNKLFNITDQEVTFNLALFICDGKGTQQQKLVEYKDLSLGRGYYYHSISLGCYIPYDYSVNDTDRLALFSSTDGGSTWKQVTCYDSEKESILLKGVYDDTPLFLKMISIEGQGLGLTLPSGNIALDGSTFTLNCNCLWNSNSNESFTGEVAIFLCDSENNRIMQVGSRTISGLPSMCLYYTWNISCQIPSTAEVKAGDRLCVFERYDGGEGWSYVDCTDPTKAYIKIPEALLPTQKSVSFSNAYATFCSRYDLDFSDVTDIYAYKAVQNNSESINLGRVTKIKAGEGVLLRGITMSDGEYSGSPAIVNSAEVLEDNLFVGVMAESTVLKQDASDVTKYVLGSLKGVAGFYKANGVTVTAGHAYLSIPTPSSSAPRSFSISFSEDDTTGIISIEEDMTTDGVYTLQGIKVDRPEKGLYIINGKKYIKK